MGNKNLDELYALVSDMAKAMNDLKDAEQVRDDILAEIPQLKSAEERIAYLKKKIDEFDQWIREKAISLYGETGERELHPAVVIKIYKGILYDETKALEWAKENAPIWVKETLDTKEFEKWAKSQDDLPDFVIVEEDPKPNISKAKIAKSIDAQPEDVPF